MKTADVRDLLEEMVVYTSCSASFSMILMSANL